MTEKTDEQLDAIDWAQFEGKAGAADAHDFDRLIEAMSPAEIDQLTAGVNDANITEALVEVGRRIIGPIPQDQNLIAAEIATLQKRMGTREWFDDRKAQMRYRALVRAREGVRL